MCGHPLCAQAAGGSAPSLCADCTCVPCVYGHPLCAQAVGKSAHALCSDYVPCVYGYPHFAQAVGKKCIRTVLRLFFFRFSFPAGRMQHPPPAQSTRNKKEARPKYCRPPHSTVALSRVCFYAEHGGSRSSWKENLAIVPSIAEKVRRNNRSVCARECEESA